MRTGVNTAAALWLAVAWTPAGPIVGQFSTLADCQVSVGYAQMQGYKTSSCLKVKRPTDLTNSTAVWDNTEH